jgi:GH25 family lysozyme M1 (1,4-beta-N-acetylmuramidase)
MISPKAAKDRKRNPAPNPLPHTPTPSGVEITLKQPFFADFSGWDGNQDISSFGLKALYTRASLGRSYTDPTFAWYKDQAAKLNIPFGAYHFFTADKAQNQIDNFLRVALGCSWPILDAEYDPGPWPLGVRGEALANMYKTWLDGVEARTGIVPTIYTNLKSWQFTYYDPTGKKNKNNMQPPVWSKDYPCIVAWYPNKPDMWTSPPVTSLPGGFTDIRGWQYADDGRSNGLPANDLNVFLK